VPLKYSKRLFSQKRDSYLTFSVMKEFKTDLPEIPSQSQIKRYYRNNLSSHAFNNTKEQANAKNFRDSRIKVSNSKGSGSTPTNSHSLQIPGLILENPKEMKPKTLNDMIMDFNSVSLPPDSQVHTSRDINKFNTVTESKASHYPSHLEIPENKKPIGSIGSSINTNQPRKESSMSTSSTSYNYTLEKPTTEQKPIPVQKQEEQQKPTPVVNNYQNESVDLLGLSDDYRPVEVQKTPSESTFKCKLFKYWLYLT
jgi:hypothetical protein